MPVCGCDGITYGNPCEAIYYGGVTSWTQGECFPNQGCYAYFSFYSDPTAPKTVYFIGPSFGFVQKMDWDFGDGSTSNDEAPVHTYSSSGIYSVCITVSDSTINCSETYCEDIYAGGSACVDSSVIDSTYACPEIYKPVCGCDGVTYSNACEALHLYGVISYYEGECWREECYAYFSYTYDTSLTSIQFTDYSSGPNTPGTVSDWYWDFGDGSTSTDQNPYHVFTDTAQKGFNVCLTVYDSLLDCSNTYCEFVYTDSVYYSNPCGINFGWYTDPATGVVEFADPGSPDSSKNYQWDFGDGTTSSDPDPSHGYSQEGYYMPCVTVYAADNSDSCIYCDSIYALAERTNTIYEIRDRSLKLNVYPNPFNNQTNIRYYLNAEKPVSINVSDILGRKHSILENTRQERGYHQFTWQSDFPSGIYMIEVNAGEHRVVMRVSLMK